MNAIEPSSLWQAQVDELQQQYRRLDQLLTMQIEGRHPELYGALGQLRSGLLVALEKVKQSPEQERWQEIARSEAQFRASFDSLLTLVTGMAISGGLGEKDKEGLDNGYLKLAQVWLTSLNVRAGVDGRPLVIYNLGPLLQPHLPLGREIVRLPFLDWDLWHLPLLARATGLLICLEDKWGYAADLLQDQMKNRQRLFQGSSALDKLGNDRACHSAYLAQLAADMLATALAGPAYAMASAVLEFDYQNPLAFNEEELRPGSAERAAAIMSTLCEMNRRAKGQPYSKMIKELEALIQAAFATIGRPQLLEQTKKRLASWHQTVMDRLVLPSVAAMLPETARQWQESDAWYYYLVGKRNQQSLPAPPYALDVSIAAVTGLWRHQFDYPDKAPLAHKQLFDRLLRNGSSLHQWVGKPAPLAQIVAQVRLERLRGRWKRMQELLQTEELAANDRATISGRFKQLISQNLYTLEKMSATTAEPPTWKQIADLEQDALPVQREALGFFGGRLIHYRGLDVEELPNKGQGPSVCDLAGAMLKKYAERTGVRWGGLTVLGADPFLAAPTEVVRLRFLDWSPWNLPLMAHEFGHLVARQNPDFQAFQAKLPSDWTRAHAEEIFADIFATYVTGPALACSAILLLFDPGQPYRRTKTHPSHDQRTAVIIQVLDHLQLVTQGRSATNDPARLLENSWQQAVANAAVTDTRASDRRKEACEWGRICLEIVETSFKLCCPFTSQRWVVAHNLSLDLLKLATINHSGLYPLLEKYQLSRDNLDDLLNGLWRARLEALLSDNYNKPILEVNAFGLARLAQTTGGYDEW
jgi:hypothetical protein